MEQSKILKDASTRSPRYGGYLKINKDLPPNSKPLSRTRQLIDSKNVYFMPDISDDWNLDKNTQYILNNVIVCVMHMATKKLNFSNKQLETAEKYLKSMKDNSTENLPNVEGILKHMSSLKKIPKPINQFGDYTYAYKHNNDIYCALDDARHLSNMNNFSQNQKSGKYNLKEKRSNYISELEMMLRNSCKKKD